eukprot:TRINITY_DN11088_c0_g1_i1.p1 TRINITY_DN11088_c0_g1~~TRINITY_DN11088_c0_g1_i1.p1  ORF type:complete len:174 (-),score=26.74 TRINITY_DN11088_c0_g1_i1:9-530(-)
MSSSYQPHLTEMKEDCNACDSLGAQMVKLRVSGAIPGAPEQKEQEQKEQVKVTSDGSETWAMSSPPDITVLGNAGWTLLHTMAAYYPSEPSERQKRQTVAFLRSFAQTFPCTYCAKDFEQIMAEHPPRVQNQKEFSYWMCEAHNQVNEHLGKPQFDCDLVDERWKIPKRKTPE